MSLNGLTGSAGLKLAPLVLETLLKHYFERLIAQKIPTTVSDGIAEDGKQSGHTPSDNLRREELLYDQAFTIVKVSFARVCSLDSIALRADEPLIRTILSHHHRPVASRTSCRLLLGQ